MRWEGPGLLLLDQTRLPVEEVWMDCESPEQVADAIRRLAVRVLNRTGKVGVLTYDAGRQVWRD